MWSILSWRQVNASLYIYCFLTEFFASVEINEWILPYCGMWLNVAWCKFSDTSKGSIASTCGDWNDFLRNVAMCVPDYTVSHHKACLCEFWYLLGSSGTSIVFVTTAVTFRFLWPCIVSKLWSEREYQQDAAVRCLLSILWCSHLTKQRPKTATNHSRTSAGHHMQ